MARGRRGTKIARHPRKSKWSRMLRCTVGGRFGSIREILRGRSAKIPARIISHAIRPPIVRVFTPPGSGAVARTSDRRGGVDLQVRTNLRAAVDEKRCDTAHALFHRKK